ncbi:MAG TPA: MarR family winged helix-turn-helix transcriptional regulator [Microbacterium sp.]|nr:MarR family winged helix-turn-helix transcriptional regulator [Microbacterium sp.]
MDSDRRLEAILRVRDELTTVSRRGTARARQMTETLTVIERALVNFIATNPGSRAIDIARFLGLNKSTVSRQLTSLHERGFVDVQVDPDDQRNRTLILTAAGMRERARVDDGVFDAVVARFAGWEDDEIVRFAAALRRFNNADV